jgi:hypothetical protein
MPKQGRSRVWLTVGAAVLLLIAGGAVFAAFGSSRPMPVQTDLPKVVTSRATTAESTAAAPATATATAKPPSRSARSSRAHTTAAAPTVPRAPRSSPSPAEPRRTQPAQETPAPSTSHGGGDTGKEIVRPPVREESSPEGAAPGHLSERKDASPASAVSPEDRTSR